MRGSAIVGFGALLTSAAHAQSVPPGDISDEIIVTGTRIPRPDAAAASQIASFDRTQIEAFREVTIEDFLNDLPLVTPDFGRTSNNPGNGSASLNLRGLGAQRTLVLLNGRRVTPTGTGSAVDINFIPAALLERVEIVTGGASAVYGSDAVTGAANFILRDDIEGLELSGQFDIYGAGDGETYNMSIAAGRSFAGGDGHITVYGDYLQRTALFGGDREFTSVVINEDRETGELEDSGSFSTNNGGFFAPAVLNGSFGFPIFEPDGSARPFVIPDDTFNFAPDNFLQTPLDRWSGGVFADLDLNDSVNIFTELMYTRSVTNSQLAPALDILGIAFPIESPFIADQSREDLRAAFDQDGDGIATGTFSKRFADVGPRETRFAADYFRGVIGVKAAISPSWSVDGYYAFGGNDVRESFFNSISRSRFLQGVLTTPDGLACADPTGGCQPVNPFGVGNISSAAIEFLAVDDFFNQTATRQHVASLTASGDVFSWREGDISFAGGFEFRRDSARFSPAEVAVDDLIGFNNVGDPIDGAINVYETFGEIIIPLASQRGFAELLELEAGGRFSHYSTAGGSWTWKVGGQWVPTDGLRIRAMWQRAVRAPNISESLTNPSEALGVIASAGDFCAARNDPAGAGLLDICLAQGADAALIADYDPPEGLFLPVTVRTQGNQNLTPETANTLTIGASYEIGGPLSFSLGVDYFKIELDNIISQVESIVPLCGVIGDPDSSVCELITRAPTGELATIVDQPVNIAVARVEGLDFSLNLTAPAPDWISFGGAADLGLRVLATHYLEFGQAATETSAFVDCAGGFENLCGFSNAGTTFPANLSTTTATYATEDLNLALRWRWIDGMDNLAPTFLALAGQAAPILPIPSIDDTHYLDLSVRYNITDTLRVTMGVDNILATQPKLLAEEQVQSNTDPSRFDIFGRRIFLRAQLALW